MPAGRPTDYSDELGELICQRVAEGESLAAICREEDMPGKATVFAWIIKHAEFRDKYRVAKEMMADAMAEDILTIADETAHDTIVLDRGGEMPNKEWIERSKLRVSARQWLMSKLMPKKYGDKTAVEHSGAVASVPMTLEEFKKRAEEAKS